MKDTEKLNSSVSFKRGDVSGGNYQVDDYLGRTKVYKDGVDQGYLTPNKSINTSVEDLLSIQRDYPDVIDAPEYWNGTGYGGAKWKKTGNNGVAGTTDFSNGKLIDANGDEREIISDKITPTKFGAKKDDISYDDLSAFNSALAFSELVEIESGENYYISAPLTWQNSGGLKGSEIVNRQEGSAVSIYAPNGFLYNADTERKFGTWSYFRVYGDGATSGITGIDGRFGGYMTGVYVESYQKLIENDFAYLLYFSRCRFNNATDGLLLATANATVIDECWFGSSIVRAIDVTGVTLGAGAVANGYPFIIKGGTNFNAGTSTEFLIRARGGVLIKGNYFECFSAPAGDSLILIEAGRFDSGFLEITGNEINGQNNVNKLIHIYGNNASGTIVYSGDISKNRMIGSIEKPIKIGGEVIAGSSSVISGVEVKANSTTFGRDYVDYSDEPANLPTQYFNGEYSGSLDISGVSYVTIPLTDSVDSYGTQVDGSGGWVCPRDGVYEVSATIEVNDTVNNRIIETRLDKNGAQIRAWNHSVTAPTVEAYYQTTGFSKKLPLLRGNILKISGRNGGFVTSADVSIARVCDYNW